MQATSHHGKKMDKNLPPWQIIGINCSKILILILASDSYFIRTELTQLSQLWLSVVCKSTTRKPLCMQLDKDTSNVWLTMQWYHVDSPDQLNIGLFCSRYIYHSHRSDQSLDKSTPSVISNSYAGDSKDMTNHRGKFTSINLLPSSADLLLGFLDHITHVIRLSAFDQLLRKLSSETMSHHNNVQRPLWGPNQCIHSSWVQEEGIMHWKCMKFNPNWIL